MIIPDAFSRKADAKVEKKIQLIITNYQLITMSLNINTLQCKLEIGNWKFLASKVAEMSG